ncbi:dTDP-4-dehydrorhamnose 3,5-epimerase [Bordetella genomosp. 1]|uniref:dTDP-4-dehydrorhamnose 3,5-epimerase n=1 Tax=Bordetella genomosp. 1 TaxID=1395607 RepID=A0ABX4F4J8_9BORD|nr:dTDP-4-dehydrorhamnose 3,5-epimerase [Bordetella genomosp. 1]MDQ8031396.1 dTDP-4-dehydrorhamnose 3,5-epimerase [Bordetella sp.]OZI66004.1 dTDP-4-dehydrorhamnose 3,5-epimerase [Bordetella genomosp. 1]
MNIVFTDTPLAGLRLARRPRAGDNRGFFSRLFSQADLQSAGWPAPVNQVNHSYTATRGSVRGMHYQHHPHADTKLVQCVRGEVWDVAVDLRRASPTFLQWHAVRLSADNGLGLLIPAGFAHGFQTLTPDAELIYCHSAPYDPASEGALHHRDPRLAIDWPLAVTEVSARDQGHAFLDPGFQGLDP